MKLADLITDAGTGQLSHTKLWANIAYAAATVAFCWVNYQGHADADIWLIYMGVVAGHSAASKAISMKYAGGQNVG